MDFADTPAAEYRTLATTVSIETLAGGLAHCAASATGRISRARAGIGSCTVNDFKELRRLIAEDPENDPKDRGKKT